MQQLSRPLHRQNFEIALIYALPVEREAVEALLDVKYETHSLSSGKSPGDLTAYITGRISGYHIVLAYLPHPGKAIAAGAASYLRSHFEGIKICIVIGVWGDNLGNRNLEITSFLRNLSCQPALQRLQHKTLSYSKELLEQLRSPEFAWPGADEDKFSPSNYRHKHQDPNVCTTCARCYHLEDSVCDAASKLSCIALGCDDMLLERRGWRNRQGELEASDGLLSRNSLMSGVAEIVGAAGIGRALLSISGRILGVLIAFEMEGAGVWQYLPTIIVKGGYSAITAAASTKVIIEEWSMQRPLKALIPFSLSDGAYHIDPGAGRYYVLWNKKYYTTQTEGGNTSGAEDTKKKFEELEAALKTVPTQAAIEPEIALPESALAQQDFCRVVRTQLRLYSASREGFQRTALALAAVIKTNKSDPELSWLTLRLGASELHRNK
ncbi:hypothetical protein TSTA_109850 [Talaromyces stipitatus ATCC 10500]|uniref:Nucleoside phosphorylase domain-containing protein n=1 Tax=Talaromyces stipitatus (strain ATCC 10500 / CBS 375.48 / QM 6759 / NRRL 1006) TaxID=441959 RepID=B8MUR7_TALSN|nr:uncharacterized protein TSTA_109850 [Talaromyces stipitatus ATCC 10500]EED11805.1 hypothetical protein TSTA_109850 [Talaromyces stipitatus ATCC 10500]